MFFGTLVVLVFSFVFAPKQTALVFRVAKEVIRRLGIGVWVAVVAVAKDVAQDTEKEEVKKDDKE